MSARRIPLVLAVATAAAFAGVYGCESFSGTGDASGADASEGDAGSETSTPPSPDGAPPADAGPGVPARAEGCADGTREAFADAAAYPQIAACEGAFLVEGLPTGGARTCDSGGGNSGPNPAGLGCSAEDLCTVGWHVCRDGTDFLAHAGTGTCAGEVAADPANPSLFYASAQPSAGAQQCGGTDGVDASAAGNDIFGCGRGVTAVPTCGPFNATLGDGCSADPSRWHCASGVNERGTVTKSLGPGGVLCCRGSD